MYHRVVVVLSPTVLLHVNDGNERFRLEGYLPNNDFLAALESGLGRIAFVSNKFPDAEHWYNDVVTRFGQSHSGPAAMNWRAEAHYKATDDHTVLSRVAEDLRWHYPESDVP